MLSASSVRNCLRNPFQRLDVNLICKLCNYFECEIGELIRYVKE
ncbi:MAG: helix-turn-helix domain-containing protein [Coprococcus comes]